MSYAEFEKIAIAADLLAGREGGGRSGQTAGEKLYLTISAGAFCCCCWWWCGQFL